MSDRCPYCSGEKVLIANRGTNFYPYIDIWVEAGRLNIELIPENVTVSSRINFCPICGRKLVES